jgi:hypothetical protein
VKVGSDADFLYYNVELHTVTGSVRVCVCLARTLLNVTGWRRKQEPAQICAWICWWGQQQW